MNLTAVFTPGWQVGDDFACAFTTYELDGSLGYASETVCALVDDHGLTFPEANALVGRLSALAETVPGTVVSL